MVGERSVDDVAVPRDPANVGRAPVHVVLVDVEDVPVGDGDPGHVSTGGVHDALRLSGRPGRVQDVQDVLRIHLLGGAFGLLAGDQVVVPDVPPLDERVIAARSPHGHHVLDGGTPGQRFLGVLLERDDLPPPVSPVAGDQDLGLRVVDAVAES